MKSAGKRSSNSSSPSNGWWNCANGIEPESNQASITSGDAPHLRRRSARTSSTTSSMIRAVQVVGNLAAALAQVGDRAGAEALLAVGRLRTPRSAAACPSSARARAPSPDVSLQPLAEAAVLDVLRCQPIRSFSASIRSRTSVVRHVPARLRVVEQRRVAAPAVRIGVLVALGAEQPPALSQRLDDVGVGLLDGAPGEVGDALVEGAVGRTGFWSVIPYCSPSRKSSSPKAIAVWTRPVPSSVVTKSASSTRVAARAVVGDVGERRLVGGRRRAPSPGSAPAPRRPRRAPRSTRAAADDEHLVGAGGPRAHVLDLGADGDRGVRDQRPRASSSRRAASRPAGAATRGSRRSAPARAIGSFTYTDGSSTSL